MDVFYAVVLFHTMGWKMSMRVNMKQTTRLHDFFHPVVLFHTMGWKKSMRVNSRQACINDIR